MSLKDDNLRFAVLKAIADAVSDEMTKLRAGHMTTLLERYDDEGTKSFEIRLPGLDTVVANISLSVPKDTLEHTDPEAFEAWLEKNHPDAVEIENIPGEPERTESVTIPAVPPRVEKYIDPQKLTAVMKHFKATTDGVVDTATGLMVDGVENKPGGRPKSFSVRYETDGRDLITQSYRDGKLNHIVSGGPLPAIDAPIVERQLVVAPAESEVPQSVLDLVDASTHGRGNGAPGDRAELDLVTGCPYDNCPGCVLCSPATPDEILADHAAALAAEGEFDPGNW